MVPTSTRRFVRSGATRNLRERAGQLALAQEAIGLATWIWDVEKDRVQWYGDIGALLGHPPRKFNGDFQNYLAAMHPDDREAARRTFVDCMKGKRLQYRSEERVIWPDGSIRWLETYGRGSYGADGRCMQMAGVVSDITERKNIDEDLRRFRAAMDISGDAILLIDRLSMRYVDVNRTFCELVGYTREELLAMTPMDLFSADRGTLERDYDAIIADNNSGASRITGEYRRKDGTRVPIETRRRALRARDGWIIVGTARDISPVVQARREQQASERKYRATFDAALDGIVILSADGFLVDVNPMCCSTTGYAREQLLGQHVSVLIGAAELSRQPLNLCAVQAAQSIRAEREIQRKDGSLFMADILAGPLPDGSIQAIVRNVSDRKRTEAELRESEARFRSLTELSSDWYWEQDEELRLSFHSNGFAQSSGTTSGKLLGKRRWEEPGRTPLSSTWDEHRAMLESRKPFRDFEYFRVGDDGARHFVSISGGPVYDDAGRFRGYRGVGRNITQRKQDEQKLARHAKRQESIARFGQFALGRHDPEQLFEEAVRSIHAHGADAAALYELVRTTDELVVRAAEGDGATASVGGSAPLPEDSPLKRITADGGPFLAGREYLSGRSAGTPWGPWVRRMGNALYVPVRDEAGPFGVLAMYSEREHAFTDQDMRFVEAIGNVLSTALQRHQAERRLAYLAQFDALTGLPNRNMVHDRLTQTIAQARRKQTHVAVLYIDLDRFKLVNDSFGHETGDGLIAQVGQRLARCTRQGDTLGRISGDEFAVLLAELADPDDAAIVAQKMLEALAMPLNLNGNEVYITASIGISVFARDGEDAETLLKNADMAMYRVKKSTRNGYRFFTSKMNQRSVARIQINTDLRHAVARSEFQLFYQPKVDLSTGALTGTEALLRWNHPQRGMVSPAEFIPALEDSGLIVAVGEWVIHEACRQIQEWRGEGFEPVPVAINLSARQFRRKDLDAEIRRALAESGVPPCLLDLEITESTLVEDPEDAVRVLGNLRAAGLKISVDDFGTGYSSLAYLTRFPLSAVKIDRSFVNAADSDGNAAAIVRAVIDMAHNLRYLVIAEGVESERQSTFLREHGCDQAQGYMFGKPMPAHDMAKRLLRTSTP